MRGPGAAGFQGNEEPRLLSCRWGTGMHLLRVLSTIHVPHPTRG